MSSENHVPRIGKREIRGAAIGAGAGAILGIIIASGTIFAQPFDAVVLILKWTLGWMIVGMWLRWSLVVEVVRWAIAGALIGVILGIVTVLLNPTSANQVDTIVITASAGIFASVIIGSVRDLSRWKRKLQ